MMRNPKNRSHEESQQERRRRSTETPRQARRKTREPTEKRRNPPPGECNTRSGNKPNPNSAPERTRIKRQRKQCHTESQPVLYTEDSLHRGATTSPSGPEKHRSSRNRTAETEKAPDASRPRREREAETAKTPNTSSSRREGITKCFNRNQQLRQQWTAFIQMGASQHHHTVYAYTPQYTPHSITPHKPYTQLPIPGSEIHKLPTIYTINPTNTYSQLHST